MKIALSGTPGVGKSKVAKKLEENGYQVLYLEDIADKFVIGYDEERKSKIVDEEAMDEYIKKIKEEDMLIIEGHLSHLLSVDAVILLRCHPKELEKRLAAKNWDEKKIKENLEAEALDVILDRALEKHEMVWEIDTTGKSIEEVVKEVRKILEETPPSSYGKIDWSSWLMENVR